ncbi:MAG: hypothetical protein LBV01_06655 [Deltaproteobacteria bacterium]|jgi:hypothetical protein|nr:hypothetical protein [Deltaproteobacteria bacterium]
MLQAAIDACDMARVAACLDVDAVVDKGVKAAMKDEAAMREANKFPAVALALALGASSGSTEVLCGLFSSEVKEYVRHGVVSGAFAGKPREGASVYGGMFGKVFRGGDKDRRVFGPATVKSRSGATARIATSLAEGRKARVYPLELVARREKGVWRIVEVANIAELIALGMKKEAQ